MGSKYEAQAGIPGMGVKLEGSGEGMVEELEGTNPSLPLCYIHQG